MSSADQDPTSDAGRRKFDEVASLFGPIVPPAGSPVRPPLSTKRSSLPQASDSELQSRGGPNLAPPPNLRAPSPEPLQSRPAAEPFVPIPAAGLKPDTIEPEPPQPARSRDNPFNPPPERGSRADRSAAPKVPWPDAFAPRPNYQPGQRWRWLYWLFLIPFAAVIAAAVTFVDPRAIRAFIDQTLPRYLPAEVTQFFSRPTPEPEPPAAPRNSSEAPVADTPTALLPSSPGGRAPEPTATVQPAAPPVDRPPADLPPASVAQGPREQAPPAQAATSPQATAPATVTTAPAAEPSKSEAVVEAPSAPASAPPPVSAGSEPVPPPSPPAVVSAAPARVVIYYRRSQAGSEGEARRIAAKVGNAEIRASSSTSRSPIIYYFNPTDREAATTLARTLAGEGAAGWIVRAGPVRQSAGAIDILLP